jgi:1,4-dihydroxy-2-naphthoate octaprenyltransferase
MECSRVYSLPTTIFSWLVGFSYALTDSGNILYGIISLFGLIFAHLGANVIDDYLDYKHLIKRVDFDKAEYLKNSQKTKCRYLINGVFKPSDILKLAIIYFGIAFCVGLFLYLKTGFGVIYFALIGGIIALIYPIVSRFCLSELAVGLAYGPALFGGVYYVMTGTYSYDVFLVSIPTMLVTIILLYVHTVMDYDFDISEGKHTISNCFNSQLDSLVVLKLFLIVTYVYPIVLCALDIMDWQIFLIYLTIPLGIDLYSSMREYACNSDSVPNRKWYHFPMEGLETLKAKGDASFMMRMYQARNLMIYFSILFIIGMIFSLAI